MARELREVHVQPTPVQRLEPWIGTERTRALGETATRLKRALGTHTVFNVNSSAAGGGVAEMLQTLLGYARGAGVDVRWMVIDGDPEFFKITKRLHNWLYGGPGDGGVLGEDEREHYEEVQRRIARELQTVVRPGDAVLIHDPQPAGLAKAAKRAGASVVWRCHVGREEPNEWTRRAWSFLAPYLSSVDAVIFSRAEFAPPEIDPARVRVIPPSVDPLATKNIWLDEDRVDSILRFVGLEAGADGRRTVPFARADGSPARVSRKVDIVQTGPPPPPDAPLVVQVSRWDRMKDMAGVMSGFAQHVDPALGANLLLVGPAVTGVADDPEAAAVLDECLALWHNLPHAARSRIHLACTPMRDADEQAVIINALQRHASVVVQKSLAEGFGLTVAEAMWKERPIVASAVGGIQDQIVNGEHGILIEDPRDEAAFGAAVERMLREPAEAARMARNARARVTEMFLPDRHLEHYADLFEELFQAAGGSSPPARPAGDPAATPESEAVQDR